MLKPIFANSPNLKYGVGLMLLTVVFGAFVHVWEPPPLITLRNAVFDQFQRLEPRVYRNVPARIIDIDDESLKRLGQWPWPRTRIAELIGRLQAVDPAAIALDMIFAEADRTSPQSMLEIWRLPPMEAQWLGKLPDHDRVLADAIGKGKVVLGFALTHDDTVMRAPLPKAHFIEIGGSPLPYLARFAGAVTSLPMLEAAAQGNGALTFNADADGIVRKVPILLQYRNAIVPSLAAEALRIAQGGKNYTVRTSSADSIGLTAINIGKITVPVTSNGEFWVRYTPPVPDRYIPAWKIFDGNIDGNSLAGHILFVGASAQGLMDLHFSPRGSGVPGIEIQAQVLEQMLSGIWLTRPSWANAAETLAVIVGGMLVGVAVLSSGALLSSLTFVLAVTLMWAAGWYAYSEKGVLIDPLSPSVLIAVTFVFAGIARHLYTECRQRWIKQAFSRYISPNLVDHLISHPQELELGGRREICSFVFTDLAGFTQLMENIDAGDAVAMLNVYLDNMIAIAFSYQGTLDRIVGDAVAIMFSAPLPQPDHQLRAIGCALAMQRFAKRYHRELAAKGVHFGPTRIGIHSGEVIVGNFGGNTIFDYRALGDTVNTASRLEAANKHLGTKICVSEATLSGCPEIKARPIGRLLVPGKSIALTVFEPLDGLNFSEAEIMEYLNAYELMRKKHPAAGEAFRTILAKRPDDYLAALHLKRLSAGQQDELIELKEK